MDHIKGSRHVCRAYSVPQSTQRLIGSRGEILLIRKLCSSALNKFEMCCPARQSSCDTVPTWSVPNYQHELKSWSLFNFAIYHTFCTVWNVQNYVIALIKQTLQFHSNSFMFVSLVAINRADRSSRRSQHGLGHGHTSHVRLHLLAGIGDDDDQIQMQNMCWVLKTPALHQTFPPLPPLGKPQATCSMFWKSQVGSSYLPGGPGGIIIQP